MSLLKHEMSFTVKGRSMDEIEQRAKEMVDAYFGDCPHTYDITVSTTPMDASYEPARWTAHVKASKNR